ncbi:hypothetical protein GGF46_004574 [Coemansia sp. RSA 552]|nr:hypothetical protein GGF46_004574 [Coemansia sp. RSA 552]
MALTKPTHQAKPARRSQRVSEAAKDGAAGSSSSSSSYTAKANTSAPAKPHPVSAALVLPPPPPADSSPSLTQLIEEYGEKTDLLKLVLAAKTEQDKARAEYERRVQEELRFETRRIEFEMLLHSHYFKQQEQQHLMPLAAAPAVHRGGNEMLLHSPIGPLSHAAHSQQQQQQQVQAVPYGMTVAPVHDPNSLRAYHHPDTPGGLDARAAQNPFAFFKMPLGAQVHHPSAYVTRPGDKSGPQMHTVGHSRNTSASSSGNGVVTSRQQASANTGARRVVQPAVSGLSVRTAGGDKRQQMANANAPHSAPVDGPEQKRRKVSHDEVIMALRRKVMGKGAQWQQQQQQQQNGQASMGRSNSLGKAVPGPRNPAQQQMRTGDASKARRSSLGVLTSIDGDSMTGRSESLSSSSSSSCSSSSSDTPLSAAGARVERVAEPEAEKTPDADPQENSEAHTSTGSQIVDSSLPGTPAGGGSVSNGNGK